MEAREYFYQLTEEVTGARLTVSYARVGGLSRDLTPDFRDRFEFCAGKLEHGMAEVEGLLSHNRIFIDRMRGVGIISPQRAMAYGFTGPVLRSTGVNFDVRKATPYLVYDRLDFEVPLGDQGDNYDRYWVRLQEMRQSLRIIRQALKQIPDGSINIDDPRVVLPEKQAVYTTIEALMNHFKLIMTGHGIRPPVGEVYQSVEGGNGELGFWVISDGSDRPWRVRVRPPCFALTSGLEEMIVGGQVADIITTFGSINMIAGELDR
jgi:NADH-quinone oxidoreductase subunit D